jgi:hypothetical protein
VYQGAKITQITWEYPEFILVGWYSFGSFTNFSVTAVTGTEIMSQIKGLCGTNKTARERFD